MLRTLFVFGILGIGVPMALYQPFYALLLYLWWALFRPEFFVWFDLAPYRLSLVLGIVLLLRTALGGKFPNVSHPLSIGALAFLLIAFVGQVTAVSPALAWFWFDYFARLVIVSPQRSSRYFSTGHASSEKTRNGTKRRRSRSRRKSATPRRRIAPHADQPASRKKSGMCHWWTKAVKRSSLGESTAFFR